VAAGAVGVVAAVSRCGITGCAGEVPLPVVTVVGAGVLPASGSSSTSRGRLESMVTVAMRSPDATAPAALAATAGALAAALGSRLIVLVCRSRSGAGGMAKLTDWSPPGVGGLPVKNIGTKMTANAIRTAAPSRRVFKFSLPGGEREVQ
jgi:hypothetical protein